MDWLVTIGLLIIYLMYLIDLYKEFKFKKEHKRPLNEEEIFNLAKKRREKDILAYFSFSYNEYPINKKYKSSMSDSRFDRVELKLVEVPSFVATLLKYKKHEWVIIAFEKNKCIDLIWMNKGYDNKSVEIKIPFQEMANICNECSYNSVLMFHNHPNSNPRLYDCTKASDTDLESANVLGKILNRIGVNLKEFVCERGSFYNYFSSISDRFLSVDTFIKEIEEKNNISKELNLLLHRELYNKLK